MKKRVLEKNSYFKNVKYIRIFEDVQKTVDDREARNNINQIKYEETNAGHSERCDNSPVFLIFFNSYTLFSLKCPSRSRSNDSTARASPVLTLPLCMLLLKLLLKLLLLPSAPLPRRVVGVLLSPLLPLLLLLLLLKPLVKLLLPLLPLEERFKTPLCFSCCKSSLLSCSCCPNAFSARRIAAARSASMRTAEVI